MCDKILEDPCAAAQSSLGMSLMQNLNITSLDLNLLVVFDAMMTLQNVNAVAQALEISQPNVSRALKKLRVFFGDELFIRSSRGMQPTAKALALRDPVVRMLDIVRQDVINSTGFTPATSQRSFVINMTDLGELAFLPKLLQHCQQHAPDISLSCVCLTPQALLDAMREGQVDLALGHFPELRAQTMRLQTLVKHPFVCLARTGHSLTQTGFTAQDYAAAKHIGLMGDGHAQRLFEERIERSGIARKVVLRTRNMMSVPFLVRQSDLIATVPKMLAYVCAEVSGFQVLKPPFHIESIPISQYWSDRQHNDPGQQWLRRCIADLLLDKDPTHSVHYW